MMGCAVNMSFRRGALSKQEIDFGSLSAVLLATQILCLPSLRGPILASSSQQMPILLR